MSEASEQIALIEWCEYESRKYPELRLLFHVPNGSNKSIAQATQFKRMGLKSGVPDLFLPVARNNYHGLFIEMKTGKGKTSENQNKWINELKMQGYCVEVAKGCNIAIEILKNYLTGKIL